MTGQELLSAANSNLLNIGTTDHCIATADGGADVTLVGQLITWAAGMDPSDLRDKADELEKLEEESYYADVTLEKPVTDLDSGWKGDGADAFVTRWNSLRSYIGQDAGTGRRAALVAQVGAMRDLADACEDLQSTLTDSLNGGGLSQVRDEYVKAMCDEGDSDTVDDAIAGVGLGATIGSPGGWAGMGTGAIIGGVYGLITSLMDSAEKDLARIAGAKVAISNVGAQFEGLDKTLVLKKYGDDNQVDLGAVEHNPRDPYGNGWDELDDEWEVES
ncbi:MAG TPA: hypothetical protein H9902_15215 [Candidatus Stackebrandtia faecavium]|nr:hypothetical protein [Candidatus Stackebrandtia faecavium]